MKAELKVSRETGPAPAAQGETIVEFDNVWKAYTHREVLAGVSLKIRKGEVLCVLGPSGTGKSVTLRHINGLEQPDKGDIRVFGESVVGLSEEQLSPVRRRVVMLFQGGALFDSMNVEQNVAFPLVEHTNKTPKEVAELVAEKLTMVGLPGTQKKMPSELSGGMRKRVALARSIALEPEIMFSITTASTILPDTVNRFSINLTVPDTELMMSAEINPDASPSFWPTSTLSPLATTGFAGAPICWDIGNTRSPFGKRTVMGLSFDSSLPSYVWIPPKNVDLAISLLPSFLFCFSMPVKLKTMFRVLRIQP
jgi:phospholipid/cholesterol/gamma-HCH transport system ATP-binding protein